LGNRSFTHSLFAHFRSFQRANEQLLFSLLFAKEQKSDRSFVALLKRPNERSLFRSFKKNEQKMSKKGAIFKIPHFSLKKRAIAHYQYEQILGNSFAHLLNCSSLIFKRAIVQSLAQSLFKKERMSDRSFCRSLQKKKSEWAIALSLFQKERKSKKER